MKSNKFLNATQIFVKACYVLLALLAIFGTYAIIYANGGWDNILLPFCIPFFLVLPAGYAVLICLDKLLGNIELDIIFDKENTEIFKKISICCFYATAIGIIACAVFIVTEISHILCVPILILACGEAFMGLIVIVIKIVFNRAIEIKTENDLTI